MKTELSPWTVLLRSESMYFYVIIASRNALELEVLLLLPVGFETMIAPRIVRMDIEYLKSCEIIS